MRDAYCIKEGYTQVVIIAHGNGRAAFERHREFWTGFGLENQPVVVQPETDRLMETGCYDNRFVVLTLGQAQHNGPDSIRRLRYLFDVLGDRMWNRCIIHEYDSISLQPMLPTGVGLFGNLKVNKEMPKFMAPIYANPPWCFSRSTFELMHAKAKQCDNLMEDGEADRWLSALAYLSGVPLFDYEPAGFSRGTIGWEDIPALREAIYKGALHIHGIKQKWVLAAAEQFYDERPKTP